jgi:hypothetical protein
MQKEFFSQQFCRFEGPVTQMTGALPEEKLGFRPTADAMSAGELLQHIADIVRDHGESMRTGDWIPKIPDLAKSAGKSKVQLLGEVKASFETARNSLSRLTQQDFESKKVNVSFGPISMDGTTEEIGVSLALIHLANHVMQLFCYLRQMGVDVDTGTLYFGFPPDQLSTRMQAQAGA